jgi:hypothetical protein
VTLLAVAAVAAAAAAAVAAVVVTTAAAVNMCARQEMFWTHTNVCKNTLGMQCVRMFASIIFDSSRLLFNF